MTADAERACAHIDLTNDARVIDRSESLRQFIPNGQARRMVNRGVENGVRVIEYPCADIVSYIRRFVVFLLFDDQSAKQS